jgi:hypothetical protein
VPTTVNDEHRVEILGEAVRQDDSERNGAGIPDYVYGVFAEDLGRSV